MPSYLLPLVPALALLAAAWGPFRTRRYAPWMVVVLAAAFLIKASAPEMPWGLDYRAGTVQPAAPVLSNYCEQARGNQLIVLELADDLYASVLPLARLRYATVVPVAAPAGPYAMPFAEMGITVTVEQFNHLARYSPAFRDRLRRMVAWIPDAPHRNVDYGAIRGRTRGRWCAPTRRAIS